MASVNPVAVTNCLYSLFVYKSTQWLKDNISGDVRRNLVWALEKLCFDKDSFLKASLVMAQLMLAENESYGNNATGQFLQLFHVVLPGTEENLVERVSLLSLLMDKGQEYFSIVIKALDSAFVSHGFHRSGSAEQFGIEKNRIICLPIKKSGTIGMLVETWLFDLLTRMRNYKEIFTN